jgi:hypothetical protein
MEKQDRQEPTSSRCLKCGDQPKFITSMLSPSAGRTVSHVRMQVRQQNLDLREGLRRRFRTDIALRIYAAAQREAAGMLVDMARDIAGELQSNPKWQIEVADETGKPILRLSVLAEPLGPPQLAASFVRRHPANRAALRSGATARLRDQRVGIPPPSANSSPARRRV